MLAPRLDELAKDLGTGRELPLDLTRLCRELGVGLRVERADGRRRGALMTRGRRMEVVVMRDHDRPVPISGQERFTIAHELGHFLILNEVHILPQRESEYWLLEELCNRFASALLIPDSVVADVPEPVCAADVAEAVNAVARRADVTAEPAARVLVARFRTPVAIGSFRIDPLGSTTRLGFRGWWAESRVWWGGRGGRRLAVYSNHPLAPVLEAMVTLRRGETAAPPVDGATSTFLRQRGRDTASFAAVLA